MVTTMHGQASRVCRNLIYLAMVSMALGARPAAATTHPVVDLLTMGPAEDLYTRFGHSAFLVHRPNRPPRVYNYGYTDFAAPSLITDFLRGRALFWVEISSYASTRRIYRSQDRSLYIQRLNLTVDQHAELARLLAQGALPQNRSYVYHHFKDNCTTRMRDLLDRVTGGALSRQLTDVAATELHLRQLVHRGFAGRLELLLLVDLILGRDLDHPPDLWEGSFLPRILRHAVQQVQLGSEPLAGPPRVLYQRRGPDPLGHDPLAGTKLLWALGGLVLLLAGLLVILRHRRWVGLPLIVVVLVLGPCALLIWGLACFSAVPDLRHNELLLLLWPTDLVLLWPAVRWLRGRPWAGRWLRGYVWARLAAVGLTVVGQLLGVLVQRPLVWLVMVGVVFGGMWVVVRKMGKGPMSGVEPSNQPTDVA